MAGSKAREWAEWWDAKDTVRPPGLGDEAFREVIERLEALEDHASGSAMLRARLAERVDALEERLDRLEGRVVWREEYERVPARLEALERWVHVTAENVADHEQAIGKLGGFGGPPPSEYKQAMRDHRAMEKLRAEEWYLLTHYRINGKNRWRFAGKEAADPADAILGEDEHSEADWADEYWAHQGDRTPEDG